MHRRFYGKADAPILVWQASTRVMNPTVPQSVIDIAMDRDSASASAEYLAEFRSDLESFVSREVIDAAVVAGRFELPPMPSARYVAFVDPSGGSSDSMTLCISHRRSTDGCIIIDAIRERKPPFSPQDVVLEFTDLLKAYGVRTVIGDRFGGEWPRERFRLAGINYELSDKPKSAIYQDCLPLLNSGRLELIDSPRLIQQLSNLERRTARSGRDSIDHGPGQHDDLANSVCGAALAASTPSGAFIIPDGLLQYASKPQTMFHRRII
jgi:hypothetical protein